MKPKFEKLLTRKHALLTDSFLVAAWNDQKRFSKLTGVKEYVQNLEIINGDFYFDKNWMDLIQKKYSAKPDNFFWQFTKRGYQHGEKLKQFARKLNLENKSPQELDKLFWQSIELMKNLLVFLPQTHPLAKIIENKAREIITSEELLITASTPKKKNGPILEEESLLKISKLKNKNKAIDEHLEKYAYLGYRDPFSSGYTKKFILNRLKKITPSHSTKPSLPKFTPAEKKIIDLMKELVYFRNYRTEKLYEALYYLEPLWLKIDKNLAYYTLEEIKDNTKINPSVLAARKKGHTILLHNNKIKISTKIKKKKNSSQAKTLSGNIACQGIIKGRAKIVLTTADQSKIKPGDILVTTMTTPNFLPAMKRAAGFITDEGGITCHAAIVAREMNKPCLIGTKNATQILKNNDIIELDANNGIVKVI